MGDQCIACFTLEALQLKKKIIDIPSSTPSCHNYVKNLDYGSDSI